MQVRFKQPLIVGNRNHVEGDVATLHDEHARRLIDEGAVERHVPEESAPDTPPPEAPPEKRQAVSVPKTRKAVKEPEATHVREPDRDDAPPPADAGGPGGEQGPLPG